MADAFEPFAGAGQVVGVEVEADQLAGRPDAAEQFGRVPAEADGAVEDDLPGLRVEGGEDLREQDRPVFTLWGGAHWRTGGVSRRVGSSPGGSRRRFAHSSPNAPWPRSPSSRSTRSTSRTPRRSG